MSRTEGSGIICDIRSIWLQVGFQWRVGGDFSRHSVYMADVVPVDCAPAFSGWARAWTHVAVIIFYAAGAASVAPFVRRRKARQIAR